MGTRTAVESRMSAWYMDGNLRHELTVIATFDPDDPCAVNLMFRLASGRARTATVARDLLIGGLDSWHVPLGEGLVRVWRTEFEHRPMLRIELRSAARSGAPSLLFDVPYRSIQQFVGCTRGSVQTVEEAAWFEAAITDESLFRLLDGAM